MGMRSQPQRGPTLGPWIPLWLLIVETGQAGGVQSRATHTGGEQRPPHRFKAHGRAVGLDQKRCTSGDLGLIPGAGRVFLSREWRGQVFGDHLPPYFGGSPSEHHPSQSQNHFLECKFAQRSPARSFHAPWSMENTGGALEPRLRLSADHRLAFPSPVIPSSHRLPSIPLQLPTRSPPGAWQAPPTRAPGPSPNAPSPGLFLAVDHRLISHPHRSWALLSRQVCVAQGQRLRCFSCACSQDWHFLPTGLFHTTWGKQKAVNVFSKIKNFLTVSWPKIEWLS